MLLVINPRAGGGTALQKWNRLERDLPRDGEIAITVVDDPCGMRRVVEQGIAAGHRTFLAGGGDGTVNALANSMLALFAHHRILGAIGLGSSNDFHKPFRTRVAGIPCRMNAEHTSLQDVGRLVITDAEGRATVRYWLVNASIGLTADANRKFNEGRGLLGGLKRISTGAAIGTAALATILRDPGRELQVSIDGWPLKEFRFRNLAFVKNPTFAGCLSYGPENITVPGAFRFHAVEAIPFPALLRILAGLVRGRFPVRRGTRSQDALTAEVSAAEPFAVEFDGEVMEAVSVEVSVIPRELEVCA
jgi:diacylglycerol kinase family enzyme